MERSTRKRSGRVRNDVKNEYITLEIARKIYGVVLDPETLELNWEETKKLRGEIKKQRGKQQSKNIHHNNTPYS